MPSLFFATEFFIVIALLEQLTFAGDSYVMCLLAAFLIGVSVAARAKRGVPHVPSSTFTLLTTGLCSFQIGIHMAYFWHDRIGEDLIKLSPAPVALCVLLVLQMMADLCGSRDLKLERILKITIYLLALTVCSIQLTSVSAHIDREGDMNPRQLICFALPLLFTVGCASFRRRSSEKNAELVRSLVTLTVLLIPLAALITARYKLESARAIILDASHAPQIPARFNTLLLVSEDPIFYEHHGVDLSRLQEALNESVIQRRFVRGGSTISMQLFKITSGDFEKTLWRKIVQIFGGALIEAEFSKAQILHAYLNLVSFGEGIDGVSRASSRYFEKSPAELTETESMALVLTIFNPALYNPTMNPTPREAKLRAAVIKARADDSRYDNERLMDPVDRIRPPPTPHR